MINIDFIDSDSESFKFDQVLKQGIKKAFNNCLNLEGINRDTEVSITFVTPERIKELNKEYRDIDEVTDVLSFPMYESKEDILSQDVDRPVLLGDIIINPQRAERQAQENGVSFYREVVFLSIHSLLHLLGYDHMEDNERIQMNNQEEKVLDTLNKKDET